MLSRIVYFGAWLLESRILATDVAFVMITSVELEQPSPDKVYAYSKWPSLEFSVVASDLHCHGTQGRSQGFEAAS